jgi:uncharacterized repeat protein (TIGR01451 family)
MSDGALLATGVAPAAGGLTTLAVSQYGQLYCDLSYPAADRGALAQLADHINLIDPPGSIPTEPVADGTVATVSSVDPNEKLGPQGVGPLRGVQAGEPLTYTIYFENLATATAPAQEVFITDQLDTDLDWTTFELGEIAFGERIVTDLGGRQVGTTRTAVDRYWVDIQAEIVATSGLVHWVLRTIDPMTGDLPADAVAGFLPPEDGSGRGQGHVSFTVRSKTGLAPGTELRNEARIIFDANAAIDTNEWGNTILGGDPRLTEAVNLRLSEPAAGTVLRWTAPVGADTYDVIRGDVESLQATPTQVDLGTVTCLADNIGTVTTTTVPDPDLPGPGRVFFYLVRPNFGTQPGSYGFGSDATLERLPASGDCP